MDSSDIRRALDRVDSDALEVEAETDCSSFSSSLNGCGAYANAITGGDEDSTEITVAFVFSNERRAKFGRNDIEDGIEDEDGVDLDLEDIETDGEIVTLKVIVYE